MTGRDASSPKSWHSMEIEAVLRHLESDPAKGLSSDQVERRLTRYGRNR